MSQHAHQKGFTLVEMVVSIGMFSTLMLLIVGALLTMTDASRKARSTRLALDNVSLAMEYMSREMRLGSYFRCETGTILSNPDTSHNTQSCPIVLGVGGAISGGGNIIGFERAGGNPNNSNDQMAFKIENNQIWVSTTGGGVGSFSPLTDPSVRIESNTKFYVDGTQYSVAGGLADQPRITIVVSGIGGFQKAKTQTQFNLQTTISVRTPNLPPP